MKTWHIILLAASIIVGIALSGGIYDITPSSSGKMNGYGEVYKINRFTGQVWWINGGGESKVSHE